MMHSGPVNSLCLKVILEMCDDGVDLPELQSIRLGSGAFSFSGNRNEKLIMKSASSSAA